MPINFLEDGIMWVESRLSGTAGALGALALDIHNWLFRFSCALEELRVVVAELADWIAPPPGLHT